MQHLPLATRAPAFNAETLAGQRVSLSRALQHGCLVIVFGMPQVHASRLVVGYLRRLKGQVTASQIVICLQGDEDEVRSYAHGYLDDLDVVHDQDLYLSHIYRVTHVPTVYLVSATGHIDKAFTGFLRKGLNALAHQVAEAYGAKPKQLITALDNKGEYELAEKALSG